MHEHHPHPRGDGLTATPMPEKLVGFVSSTTKHISSTVVSSCGLTSLHWKYTRLWPSKHASVHRSLPHNFFWGEWEWVGYADSGP